MTLSTHQPQPGTRRFRFRTKWATAGLALFMLGMLLTLVVAAPLRR